MSYRTDTFSVMSYRTDTFEIDDKITWLNDYYAELTNGRKRFGDGPFTVKAIDPVRPKYYCSAGHTQLLYFKEGDFEIGSRFSGAYFKKVD